MGTELRAAASVSNLGLEWRFGCACYRIEPCDSFFLSISTQAKHYYNEDTEFCQDPHAFVRHHFPACVSAAFPPSPNMLDPEAQRVYAWPSHLVVFDALLKHKHPTTSQPFSTLLAEKGYVELERFWNSFLHEDSRRNGDVVVLASEGRRVE